MSVCALIVHILANSFTTVVQLPCGGNVEHLRLQIEASWEYKILTLPNSSGKSEHTAVKTDVMRICSVLGHVSSPADDTSELKEGDLVKM